MPEGVAEVEQRPITLLTLVPGDDRRLRPTALRDRMIALGAAGKNAAPVLLAPDKKGLIVDQPVLHHFRVAGPGLAWRQCIKKRGIGDDEARLVERANEVFAMRRVDPGLAAH